MSRSVQTTTPVMSDAEFCKSLERTITTNGPDTYVETSWPRGDNDAPR